MSNDVRALVGRPSPQFDLKCPGLVLNELNHRFPIPLTGRKNNRECTPISGKPNGQQHGEGFFRWVHLSCSHESHYKVSLQGISIMKVIARSHCKESLQGVKCKESWQGVIARSHCKESLQGVIARSHCKESWQGVMARSHCKESWQGVMARSHCT